MGLFSKKPKMRTYDSARGPIKYMEYIFLFLLNEDFPLLEKFIYIYAYICVYMFVCFLFYFPIIPKFFPYFFFFFNIHLFNCATSQLWNLGLLIFIGIFFSYGRQTLHRGMWGIVSSLGTKPGPPAMRAWSPGHWTMREVLIFPLAKN